MSDGGVNAIRPTYPPGKQYIAFPETNGGRVDLDTFARRMDGLCSWQMAKRLGPLLIKTCIMKDRKREIIRNSAIWIFTFRFYYDAFGISHV